MGFGDFLYLYGVFFLCKIQIVPRSMAHQHALGQADPQQDRVRIIKIDMAVAQPGGESGFQPLPLSLILFQLQRAPKFSPMPEALNQNPQTATCG